MRTPSQPPMRVHAQFASAAASGCPSNLVVVSWECAAREWGRAWDMDGPLEITGGMYGTERSTLKGCEGV